jgi:hypothetical protein
MNECFYLWKESDPGIFDVEDVRREGGWIETISLMRWLPKGEKRQQSRINASLR